LKQKSYDILDRPSLSTFKEMVKFPVRVVLDNLRSGLNIGSAFRTGDAFAIEGIELCGICATPPNKEILKTALGSTDSVKWNHYPSTQECLEKLKENGYTIIAIETATESISLQEIQFDKAEKLAFIFGNEVNGINDEVMSFCDKSIEIPQLGTKHSFNVSVSIGIVLWEYIRQIKSHG